MTTEKKREFARELLDNLKNNILPYWLEKMYDPETGGYYGRRDGNDRLHADAPRGAILNARLLWTLSAAARTTGDKTYAQAAARQYDYIAARFIDREFGGVYWSVNPDGTPCDTRKQFYAIAFTIYGLAEYYRICGDRSALDTAISLFRSIEDHSRDRVKGGYLEATTRDWQKIADMRLSDKDLNSSKTMNTHLHILEAYTNLLRVWQSPECREATASLLRLFNTMIVDPASRHLGLFFDDDMKRVDGDISYGHDIEASWLMLETARVLVASENSPENRRLFEDTLEVTRTVALAALEGRESDGSLIYERHADGSVDAEKHWWVQAENVIGQIYLEKFHGVEGAADRAFETWRYIDSRLVDRENGEWLWSRFPDGTPNRRDDKAGFWKCPYHNSRMCIEAAECLG